MGISTHPRAARAHAARVTGWVGISPAKRGNTRRGSLPMLAMPGGRLVSLCSAGLLLAACQGPDEYFRGDMGAGQAGSTGGDFLSGAAGTSASGAAGTSATGAAG